MDIVVCGSRSITDSEVVMDSIETALDEQGISVDEISCVLSGGAVGVDSLAEEWAREEGVEVSKFLPDWEEYGNQAGVKRNREMVDVGDVVIAIWDGKSLGTRYTIEYAEKADDVDVEVVVIGMKTLGEFI